MKITDKDADLIVKFLTIITLMLITFTLGTLVFYGLGSLIVWAFNINFEWTIWHSVCAEMVYCLIKGMFSKKE